MVVPSCISLSELPHMTLVFFLSLFIYFWVGFSFWGHSKKRIKKCKNFCLFNNWFLVLTKKQWSYQETFNKSNDNPVLALQESLADSPRQQLPEYSKCLLKMGYFKFFESWQISACDVHRWLSELKMLRGSCLLSVLLYKHFK